MDWYPIKLTAHIRHYKFGERLIPERLGKSGVPGGIIAETWEISDYRDTAGLVTNGSMEGRSIHELVTEHPDALVGTGWSGPHFPLLEKFLDASHMLPVHLHADDQTAQQVHGEPNGKTEAWHILWAAAGASILAGIKPGLSREHLFRAFKEQEYDAVMYRYPIRAGDTVYVPGGVLHSFGPDTLIFEIQQTSDLGQSVMPYDLFGSRHSPDTWDRNINATLDELHTEYLPRPNPGLVLEDSQNTYTVACAGPHFALERWTLKEMHHEPPHPRRCMTLSNIGSPVRIDYAGGTEMLDRAQSCILPAAIGDVRIFPSGEARLLVGYVPDLQQDIMIPLTKAGYSEDQIRALGEVEV